jgi:O-antigen ligase
MGFSMRVSWSSSIFFGETAYLEDRHTQIVPLQYKLLSLGLVFLVACGRWTFARLEDDSTAQVGLLASKSYAILANNWLFQIGFWIAWVVLVSAYIIIEFRPRSWQPYRASFLKIYYILCILTVYMIASSIWSTDIVLALCKSYELVYLIIIMVLLNVLQSKQPEYDLRQNIFIYTFYFYGIFAIVGFVSIVISSDLERLCVLGGGPNTFGRNMGLLGIGMFYKAFGSKWRSLYFLAGGLSFLLVVASGSRGAMVSSLCGLIFLFAVHGGISIKRLIISLIAFCCTLCSLFFIPGIGPKVIELATQRIVEKTIQEHYVSLRDTLAADAIAMWQKSPVFGEGLASFWDDSNTGFHYPHNICLEILSEGGVVGFAVLIIAFAVFFRQVRCFGKKAHTLSLSAFVLYFVGAQFSGDLFDSRTVFLYILMASYPEK